MRAYPSYTESKIPWQGRRPGRWTVARLQHVARAWTSNVDKHTLPGQEMVRLCNYTDVYKNDSIRDNLTFMEASATPDQIERFRLAKGDTLLTKDSETAEDIGVPAYVEYEAPDLICGYHLAIVRPDPEAVDSRFLYWVMMSDQIRSQWSALAAGVTRVGIRSNDLKKAQLLLPPRVEQRAIADFLDRETARIDMLVAKQEQLIETLRERKLVIAAESLTGIHARHMTKLKRIAVIQGGVTLSGEGNLSDPEWPYLRVANVQVGRVDLEQIKTLRLPESEARHSMLRAGDVLMTEGGDIDKLGRGALWRGEIEGMLHQNHIFAVRPSADLTSRFLVYWLDGPSARYYFRATARKTTNLASTNKWTLGNLPVACPSLDEQSSIVELLDSRTQNINLLIAKAETFVALARERRAALITAAVTGQIDVTSAA